MVLSLTQLVTENEYQEYFLGDKGGRCVVLTVLQPSCADCQKMWAPQPPGNLWTFNRPAQVLLYLYLL